MKKTISLFLIVFVLLFTLAVPAQAVVFPTLPSGVREYWLIAESKVGGVSGYWLFASDEPVNVPKTLKYLDFNANFDCYKLEGGKWSFVSSHGPAYAPSLTRIYVSNHDICYNDGSVFFFPHTELVRAVKKTEFGAILTATFRGLTPILGCLILVACFRIAWGFLLSQLRS